MDGRRGVHHGRRRVRHDQGPGQRVPTGRRQRPDRAPGPRRLHRPLAAARDLVVGVGRRRPGPQPPRSVAVRPVRRARASPRWPRRHRCRGGGAEHRRPVGERRRRAARGWRRRRPRHGARRGRPGVDDGQRGAVRRVAAEHPRPAVLRLPRARLGGLRRARGSVAVGRRRRLVVRTSAPQLPVRRPGAPRRRRPRPVAGLPRRAVAAPRAITAAGAGGRPAGLGPAPPRATLRRWSGQHLAAGRGQRRRRPQRVLPGRAHGRRRVGHPAGVVPPGLRHGHPAHAMDADRGRPRARPGAAGRGRGGCRPPRRGRRRRGHRLVDPPPRRPDHGTRGGRVPRHRGRRAVLGGDHPDRHHRAVAPQVALVVARGGLRRGLLCGGCRACRRGPLERDRPRRRPDRSPWGSASSCRC